MKNQYNLRIKVLKALERRRFLFPADIYSELHYIVTKSIKHSEGGAWIVKHNAASRKKAYHCNNCDYRSGVPAKRCIGCGLPMTDDSGIVRVKRHLDR